MTEPAIVLLCVFSAHILTLIVQVSQGSVTWEQRVVAQRQNCPHSPSSNVISVQEWDPMFTDIWPQSCVKALVTSDPTVIPSWLGGLMCSRFSWGHLLWEVTHRAGWFD